MSLCSKESWQTGGDSPLGGTGGGCDGRVAEEDRKAGRGGASRDFLRRGGSGGGSEPGGCFGWSVESHKWRLLKPKRAGGLTLVVTNQAWNLGVIIDSDLNLNNQCQWCSWDFFFLIFFNKSKTNLWIQKKKPDYCVLLTMNYNVYYFYVNQTETCLFEFNLIV